MEQNSLMRDIHHLPLLLMFVNRYDVTLIIGRTLSVLIFARTNFRAFAQKSEKCAKISTVITRKGVMRES